MQNEALFRKGIILAGGSGTRLYPVTRAISKQLLPIYDKPMIYYPLATLMAAGIRNILLISTPQDIAGYERLFGDGSHVGLTISYATQLRPEGLAQAFIIGRDFVGSDHCALILGDNLFYLPPTTSRLQAALQCNQGATIVGDQVDEPQRYGIVEFGDDGRVVSVEEKPTNPRSSYAIPGLYFYDNQVLEIAANLRPSVRGEFEITDVNREYLRRGQLFVERIDRDATWMDAGTHDSLLAAAQFVQSTEVREERKIGCIEEIAYRQGFIDAAQLQRLAATFNNDYGRYLQHVANNSP